MEEYKHFFPYFNQGDFFSKSKVEYVNKWINSDNLTSISKIFFSKSLYYKYIKYLFPIMAIENKFSEWKDDYYKVEDWDELEASINYLEDLSSENSFKNNRIIFLDGWRFRCRSPEIQPGSKEFNQIFGLESDNIQIIDFEISKIRKEKKYKILSIHHRKSDFRAWLNGKYFYSNEMFLKKIRQVKEYFENKKIDLKCFLFSDEHDYEPETIQELDIEIKNYGIGGDLYFLSQSDYIIGPPSTFSGWAAFSGQNKICMLHSIDQEVTLDKFVKIDTWNGLELKNDKGQIFIL